MQRRPTNTAQEKNTSSGQKEMDAIELLKQDHERVTELFGQYAGAEVEERRAIAQRTFKELEIHGILEEELFYPALQNQGNPDEFATLPQGDIDINGEARFLTQSASTTGRMTRHLSKMMIWTKTRLKEMTSSPRPLKIIRPSSN